MKNLKLGLLASILAFGAMLFGSTLAAAAPVPYINAPLDTIQATVNAAIANINNTVPTTQPYQTATGSAGAATLNGVKGTVTTEALATAAGATYTWTLTDSSINASSVLFLTASLGTATTGAPVPYSVVPAAGSVVVKFQNVGAGALNGTITISFMVVN